MFTNQASWRVMSLPFDAIVDGGCWTIMLDLFDCTIVSYVIAVQNNAYAKKLVIIIR